MKNAGIYAKLAAILMVGFSDGRVHMAGLKTDLPYKTRSSLFLHFLSVFPAEAGIQKKEPSPLFRGDDSFGEDSDGDDSKGEML